MTTLALQPALPLAADGATLNRVLQRAGVNKKSVVRVTGPAGTTAIMWLCRHGYERAAYVHAKWVATMETADALLIPQTCTSQELTELLQGGTCLRAGGALIVQTPSDQIADGPDSIPAVLQSLGYDVEQHLSDRGREVYIARRRGSGGFRKAA